MTSCYFTILFILALHSISTTALYHPCSQEFYSFVSKKNITHCKKLNSFGAEFGWGYQNQTNGSSSSAIINIYFGTKLESEVGWLAWGVNPQAEAQMVGTRALIGIKQPNETPVIYTYNITSETKLGCRLLSTPIDVEVRQKEFLYLDRIQYYVIAATLVLPSAAYNISRLNVVWQVGHAASGNEPLKHHTTLQNVDSLETIDLNNGKGTQSVREHQRNMRKVHGILNILGWGTFMPIGVIIARYFRNFPVQSKWWFRLHLSFQIGGYILGTIGWGFGLWLGHASKHYVFHIHRVLAMFIFSFTTLQMLSLRLRPGPKDEYRKYWNMYHHFLGYALLALISTNIFQGIAILNPQHTWKWIYIGLLGVLLSITVAMEIYTWVAFTQLKKKKCCSHKRALAKSSEYMNMTTTLNLITLLHDFSCIFFEI